MKFLFVGFCLSISTLVGNAQSFQDSLDFSGNYFESLRLLAIDNGELAVGHLERCTSLLPEESSSYYLLGTVEEQKKNIGDAIKNYKEAYELSEDNEWYMLSLAKAYLLNGENKAAYKLYENALKKDQFNENLIVDYAKLLESNGDFKESAKYYEQYCAIKKDTEFGLKLVRLYYKAKNFDGALTKTEQLLEENPYDYELWVLKGELLIGMKKAADNEAYFTEMNSKFPDIPDAQYTYSEYLYQQEKYDELLVCLIRVFREESAEPKKKVQLFKQVLNDKKLKVSKIQVLDLLHSLTLAHPESYDINYLAGQFYYNVQKYQLAADHFSAARNIQPNNFSLWETELNSLLAGRKLDKAIQVADSAQMLYPTRPEVYLLKGIAHSMKKEYEQGVEQFEMGSEMVVDNPMLEANFNKAWAQALYGLKQYDASFALYDKVLKVTPNDISTLNNYSYYLADQSKNLDKAKVLIEKVLAQRPSVVNYLDTYGWVLFQRGDYNLAIDVFEKILVLNNSPSAVILEHYGDVLVKLKRTDLAKSIYEKAIVKDKNNESIQNKLKKLNIN